MVNTKRNLYELNSLFFFFFSHIWDQLEIVIRNALYIKEPANTLKNAFATSLTDTVVKKERIKDKIFCDRNSRYGKQVVNFFFS